MEILKQLLPLIIMTTILYFVLVVPQRKRSREFDSMMGNLQVNDEIITKGGILGKIVNISDETMIIQTGPDRVRLKIAKAGILDKVSDNVDKKKEVRKEKEEVKEEIKVIPEVKEENKEQ